MAPKGKLRSKKPASADELVQAGVSRVAEELAPEESGPWKESRDKAPEDLDLVLQEFQRKHKKGKPDFKALKEALTPNQMSTLWMRLKK